MGGNFSLQLSPSLSPSPQKTKEFLFHTAKVMDIAWSPNSAYIVSGSIDTNIIVWTAATGDRDEIRGLSTAHSTQ